MESLTILGVTGSIGKSTLEVIRDNLESFSIEGMSCGQNIELFENIIDEFKVKYLCVEKELDALKLKAKYPECVVFFGESGLISLIKSVKSKKVINALVGFVGLKPTLEAIAEGKDVLLANKEALVVGGELIMKAVEDYKVNLLPLDSEHSAILQCLQGNDVNAIKNIILTASGGSFRDLSYDQLNNVSINDALKHPNWSMGAKITIDSATMMNKGFEVIEAHWLFGLDYDKIKVLLHRESIVHSLVEFVDNSLLAQLGTASMKLPIQYALTFPLRSQMPEKDFNFLKIKTLNFEEIDYKRYPLLELSYLAGRKGGNLPVILNAANEVAVNLFLKGRIKFLEIEYIISNSLKKHDYQPLDTLEEIVIWDKLIREEILKEYGD